MLIATDQYIHRVNDNLDYLHSATPSTAALSGDCRSAQLQYSTPSVLLNWYCLQRAIGIGGYSSSEIPLRHCHIDRLHY